MKREDMKQFHLQVRGGAGIPMTSNINLFDEMVTTYGAERAEQMERNMLRNNS